MSKLGMLDKLKIIIKKTAIGILASAIIITTTIETVSAASFPSQYDNKMPVALGIDVSKWNNKSGKIIDWQAVKDFGISFVIIKISKRNPDTEISDLVDEYFEDFYNGAGSVGLKRGVYVFSYAKNKDEAIQEAQAAINTMNGRPLEMPITYDFESNGSMKKLVKKGKAATSEALNAFCDVIEENGYDSMIYTGEFIIKKYIDHDAIADRKLWIARYPKLGNKATYGKFAGFSPTDYPYYMWQLSSTAYVPSISYKTTSKGKTTHHCDVNFIYDPAFADPNFNSLLEKVVATGRTGGDSAPYEDGEELLDEYDNEHNNNNNNLPQDTNDLIEPTSIQFIENGITIDANTTPSKKLEIDVFPTNANRKNIQFFSSDDNIAKVANDGTITPIKAGSAVITASTGAVSSSTLINIVKEEIKIEKIKLNLTEVMLFKGETGKIEATVTPENKNIKIKYYVDDKKIATISSDGTIKAKSAGETIITAQVDDKIAECDLIVKDTVPEKKDDIKQKDAKNEEKALNEQEQKDNEKKNEENQKKSKKEPENKENKNNKKDKTKKENGDTDNKDSKTKKEKKPLDIKESSVKLGKGDTYQFSFTIPKNADINDIVWHSSDIGIISGYNNGKMKALEAGTATLTVTSKSDSSLKDTVNVTVFNPPSSLSANVKNKSLKVGQNFRIKPKFEKNTYSSVKYSTSDKRIVRVSRKGNIRAVKKGTAVITITTGNNLKTTVKITVK